MTIDGGEPQAECEESKGQGCVGAVGLSALAGPDNADVVIASVPLPKDTPGSVAFDGMASQAVPIAWYPPEQLGEPAKPRQVLVMGLPDGEAPDPLALTCGQDKNLVNPQPLAAPESAIPGWTGPTWRSAIVEEKKTGLMMREVNELVLEHAGRRLGIRMGIELSGGGYHWWEWLQVEQLWTGPVCTAIRAAGYIGVTALTEEELFNPEKYNTGEWLHKHNWLQAEVSAQVFANGLVRITARHVNNRSFDQGQNLEGFVPVVAFNAPGKEEPESLLDGTNTDLRLGDDVTGVHLDLERCADLVSPEHPGRIHRDGALVVCQPYEGTEYDRGCSKAHGGDDKKDLRQPADRWQIETCEQRMWKGMARSFGFDLSFAARPLRTRRYLPPYGWLGHAGALWPDGLLPARGSLEARCDEQAFEKVTLYQWASPPAGSKPFCSGRFFQASVGIDGEYAHGLMRQPARPLRGGAPSRLCLCRPGGGPHRLHQSDRRHAAGLDLAGAPAQPGPAGRLPRDGRPVPAAGCRIDGRRRLRHRPLQLAPALLRARRRLHPQPDAAL
jgi:hypothetical protein